MDWREPNAAPERPPHQTMPIAEIHIIHPDLVLSKTIERASGVQIIRELQPVTIPDWGKPVLFFSVNGEFEHFEDLLNEDPTVDHPKLVADLAEQQVFRVDLPERVELVTPKLAELGVQILEMRSGTEGWILKLQLPDLDALISFRAFCRREGISFEVETLYHEESTTGRREFGLTDIQRQTLVMARDRGYFDDPRKITLEELASEIGITPTGVGRRLRRGMGRLIDVTLLSNREH